LSSSSPEPPATVDTHGQSIALLTEEQIEASTRLLSSGIPATEVARVMARMRAERVGGSGQASGSSEMGMGTDTVPPGYDALFGG